MVSFYLPWPLDGIKFILVVNVHTMATYPQVWHVESRKIAYRWRKSLKLISSYVSILVPNICGRSLNQYHRIISVAVEVKSRTKDVFAVFKTFRLSFKVKSCKDRKHPDHQTI